MVFDSSLLSFRGINNLKHIRSFRRKWTLSCVPQAWGTFYTTVCVRIRPFWRRKCYGLGWNLSWWLHSDQNCSWNIECRKIQKQYSWSYHSALSATAKLWSRLSTWQCKISSGSCLSRLSEPESHPCSSLAGIITGSVTNWTFIGCTRKTCWPQLNPPETPQKLHDALVHEWNNFPQAYIQRLVGSIRWRCEAVVAARGGHTRYWIPQTSILHDNFCMSMICSDNDIEKFC